MRACVYVYVAVASAWVKVADPSPKSQVYWAIVAPFDAVTSAPLNLTLSPTRGEVGDTVNGAVDGNVIPLPMVRLTLPLPV